jgi:hypothetical protein
MRTRTLFISLVAATLAASALAQTKTSGTAVCKEEAPAPVAVGDVEGHAYAVGKSQCTWSKFEVGGVPFKDGTSVLTVEMRGNESKGSGYHTATLANGDKCSCSFQGTSTAKDNKFVSGGGTWTFTSGTGRCKGIKGKGTYKGTPNPDGTVSYQVDGEYTLP